MERRRIAHNLWHNRAQPNPTEPLLWLGFIPCVSFMRAGSSAAEQGTFNPKVVGSIPTRPIASSFRQIAPISGLA
jgi:hypothetical protein